MQKRRCDFCLEKLPDNLRADARFCPGPRCRVAALRRRRNARETSLLGPTKQDNRAIIASAQRRRQSAGLPPLIADEWCQLSAEILACEILADYYRDKGSELSSQRYKLDYVSGAEESIIKKGKSLFIEKKVARIGLVKLPADCKVSAVVVTTKHR